MVGIPVHTWLLSWSPVSFGIWHGLWLQRDPCIVPAWAGTRPTRFSQGIFSPMRFSLQSRRWCRPTWEVARERNGKHLWQFALHSTLLRRGNVERKAGNRLCPAVSMATDAIQYAGSFWFISKLHPSSWPKSCLFCLRARTLIVNPLRPWAL